MYGIELGLIQIPMLPLPDLYFQLCSKSLRRQPVHCVPGAEPGPASIRSNSGGRLPHACMVISDDF